MEHLCLEAPYHHPNVKAVAFNATWAILNPVASKKFGAQAEGKHQSFALPMTGCVPFAGQSAWPLTQELVIIRHLRHLLDHLYFLLVNLHCLLAHLHLLKVNSSMKMKPKSQKLMRKRRQKRNQKRKPGRQKVWPDPGRDIQHGRMQNKHRMEECCLHLFVPQQAVSRATCNWSTLLDLFVLWSTRKDYIVKSLQDN